MWGSPYRTGTNAIPFFNFQTNFKLDRGPFHEDIAVGREWGKVVECGTQVEMTEVPQLDLTA